MSSSENDSRQADLFASREPETPLPLRRSGETKVARPRDAPRRILVLGATSGIAEACCRLWAERGECLYLVGRSGEKLASVAADLKTRGAAYVDSAVVNLDDIEVHPELLAHAINSLGGLDIAYLTLGVLGDQAKAERSFVETAQILHTNYVAPVSLLTWLANYCAQRHSGTLAVLSSVAGERGRKSNYVYGSSKAGLTAFLGGLRNRIAREGVRVMTIKPGPVKTSMTEGMKGSEKFADVNKVAATIVKAIDRGQDIVYVPGIWRVIMGVIRAIPEPIFKKLNL
ncbi:MAG TPA: SDR family oxidoreductase [Acidobacteriaceae bacterium]|jgi:short-subunit dehydrogenase